MARVLAASACGAVVALGLSKLLRGKAEARVDTLKFLILGAFCIIFFSYTSTETTRKCRPLSFGRICHSLLRIVLLGILIPGPHPLVVSTSHELVHSSVQPILNFDSCWWLWGKWYFIALLSLVVSLICCWSHPHFVGRAPPFGWCCSGATGSATYWDESDRWKGHCRRGQKTCGLPTSPAVSTLADSNCQVRGEIKKGTADVLEHLSESVSNIDKFLGSNQAFVEGVGEIFVVCCDMCVSSFHWGRVEGCSQYYSWPGRDFGGISERFPVLCRAP